MEIELITFDTASLMFCHVFPSFMTEDVFNLLNIVLFCLLCSVR